MQCCKRNTSDPMVSTKADKLVSVALALIQSIAKIKFAILMVVPIPTAV